MERSFVFSYGGGINRHQYKVILDNEKVSIWEEGCGINKPISEFRSFYYTDLTDVSIEDHMGLGFIRLYIKPGKKYSEYSTEEHLRDHSHMIYAPNVIHFKEGKEKAIECAELIKKMIESAGVREKSQYNFYNSTFTGTMVFGNIQDSFNDIYQSEYYIASEPPF